LGYGRNLNRTHAVFAGDRLRGVEDRPLTLGKPANDVLGAAINHTTTEC
jgi:hypothetical protein